jgi:hypothetical protein
MWERTGLVNTKAGNPREEKIDWQPARNWAALGLPPTENNDTGNQVSEGKTRDADEQPKNNRILEQSVNRREEEQQTTRRTETALQI